MAGMLSLSFPVVTLEGELLLPAGTPLSEQVMAEIAAAGRLVPREQIALLSYGSVCEDLRCCLAMTPYNEVFGDAAEVEDLMARMDAACLPLPLLRLLDYFRTHDFHTYRHILTVFALSTLIGDDLFPGEVNRSGRVMAGPTHDFGKVCIPLSILKKSSPLTRLERNVLNHHPLAGQVLLAYYLGDHRHPAVTVSRDHHERRDGSGYPRGITDLEPIVELVAACDIYDALMAPRPYRPLAYDNRSALEELTTLAEEGKLGWECVTALVARNRRGRPSAAEVVVSRDRRGSPPVGNCYGILEEDAEPLPGGQLAVTPV